jgi:probable phosphoglycerate mutase
VTGVDLLIVRHGQSVWNARGIWQGTEDPPLSDLGRRQAELAADHLDDRFDEVWSSDLERAHQTAETMARSLGLATVRVIADLRERFAGPWQGRTREQIEDRWPGWLDSGRRPEQYETDEQLSARVLPALCAAAKPVDGRRVLVVAHGGVIISLDRHLGEDFHRYPNLTGRWYRFAEDGIEPGERVDLIPPSIDLGLE